VRLSGGNFADAVIGIEKERFSLFDADPGQVISEGQTGGALENTVMKRVSAEVGFNLSLDALANEWLAEMKL
jgi:hypothetical protein